MNEFTYTNIFDTKGIEYIIIIGFLLLIIPFWIALNQPLKMKKVFRSLTNNLLKIPQGLFFSKNYTWAHLEKSGNATIGLNDLLMHITGKVKLINLKSPGQKVSKGELIAELIQDDKLLKITSPISGDIQMINNLHNEMSDLINDDPCGKGWICKIKPENWIEETNSYYLANDAIEWSKRELLRFKDFIAVSMKKESPETSMIILQEGGELTDNPLSGLSKEIWKDFQKQFIDQTS